MVYNILLIIIGTRVETGSRPLGGLFPKEIIFIRHSFFYIQEIKANPKTKKLGVPTPSLIILYFHISKNLSKSLSISKNLKSASSAHYGLITAGTFSISFPSPSTTMISSKPSFCKFGRIFLRSPTTNQFNCSDFTICLLKF